MHITRLPWLLLLILSLASCQPSPPAGPATPPPLRAGAPLQPELTASPPVLPQPASPLPTTAATPTPATPASAGPLPSPSVSPTPARRPETVFVIVWDGGRADLVYDLMQAGRLPHFTALARQGLRAEYAQTIDPSLTANAHSSLASGQPPAVTGIVSNSYHCPYDSFYWYRRGFDEPLDRVKPAWVAASRAGLTTATVFFPGASPAHIGQTADLTIGYGLRDAYSTHPTVRLAPAPAWAGAPASYSQPLEGAYTVAKVTRLYLLVIDLSDDGVRNYDTVLISSDAAPRRVGTDTPALKRGEWGDLILLPSTQAGASFLIQEITPTRLTFYHTNVYHNTAAPRPLLEALNARFGFFRAADAYALQHGWITPYDFLYQLERAALWMAEVTRWVYTTYQPDLLFTWQESFDAAGHSFFLREPRQQGYTQSKAAQDERYLARAALAADRALQVMLSDVNLEATTLLMIADHGMAPVHTSVYVNTLLEQAGLLVLDSRDYVVMNRSRAFAVASGGAVNIYINLADHEKNGIVSPEEYPVVQAQIMDLFANLRDPTSGAPVFQRVLPQVELGALGLDHPNSGDIFAQANPGYHLDGWRGIEDVFQPAPLTGQHGYDSRLPEMRALFIAAGSNIPEGETAISPLGRLIPPVQVIDLAATLARLLNFELPVASPGVPVPGLLYP